MKRPVNEINRKMSNFKFQGGPCPPASPSDAHVCMVSSIIPPNIVLLRNSYLLFTDQTRRLPVGFDKK